MRRLNWYISRFFIMSISEIGFRINQNFSSKRQWVFRKKNNQIIRKIANIKLPSKIFDYNKLTIQINNKVFPIFEQNLDIYSKINWHKDPLTLKEFPLIQSKKINTRGSKFGDAKYVWEINRLTFLLIFALNYNSTKEQKYLDIFQKQLNSWIDDNPYLIGVNWYSNIEVNLRLILWFFCWEVLDVNKIILENKEFEKFVIAKWLPTIYLHCSYSYENPSKYSSANNHLISEYSGLFIASNYWQFKESPQWKKYAFGGLEKEIKKQHSNNGINKEQAAEYIQFITDFFIMPLVIADKQKQNIFSENYKTCCKKIIDYIFDFTDTKCNYPKYGDEDDGIVLKVDFPNFNNFHSLILTGYNLFKDEKYLSKIVGFDNKNNLIFPEKVLDSVEKTKANFNSSFFPEEGHFVYKAETRDGKEIYIYFKATNLGYLGTAAHGHADALSFILYFNGKPIIVDPGTYTYYGNENYRKYFKGTFAHNTIRIDKKDQAHYGGSMLWLNHYKCQILESKYDEDGFVIEASHNGYNKIGVEHRRKIIFSKKSFEIIIIDKVFVTDNSEHNLELPFHFHPSVNYSEETKNNSHVFISDNLKIRITNYSEMGIQPFFGSEEPICGWYSENYGKIEKSNTIVFNKKIKKSTEFKTVIRLEEI